MSLRIPDRRVSGFSLVELLVATAIGLIGIIIMLQVFENAEGVRRTTISGGDAQQNGALALYSVERDLRNAGMGINEIGLLAPPCNIVGYDAARATPNIPPVLPSTIVFAPIQIVPGGTATTPDQIDVFYGSQTQANTTTLVTNVAMTSTPNALTLDTVFGYRPGDLLLLFQPSLSPGPLPQNCILMEVTSINSNQVFHANGTYTLANSLASVQARFNPPNFSGPNAAMGLTFTGSKVISPGSTRVYNLGNIHDTEDFPGTRSPRLPVFNVYAISNNSLTVANQFVVAGGNALVASIADNIVHMRADYGLDDGLPAGTAGDGILDRFLDAASFNALPTPPWQYIISMRIAVVARSALPEKAGPGVACDGTSPFPTWSGATSAVRGFDLSAVPSPAGVAWDCYRYRVFETVVPVRNSIWRSS
jgi:type IV pilus assembly protein PilW